MNPYRKSFLEFFFLYSCCTLHFRAARVASSTLDTTASALYSRQVDCPNDPSLRGYVSIEDMNEDMKQERAMMGAPQDRYLFRICPGTTLKVSQPLVPILDRVEFVCGRAGNSRDNCTFQGGTIQVMLPGTNESIENHSTNWSAYTVTTGQEGQSVSILHVFRGIRFHDSQQLSIAALALSNSTTAEFYNCHWKVRFGS